MVNLEIRRTDGDIMENVDRFVKRSEELREKDLVTDAEELIRDALEDYEESWQLWSELGQILIRKQDFSEAASAFENATNIGPGEFWPWLYLGHAQRELGDFQAAIEATENALNVEIGETELNLVYYHLARYCALLDRKEEAMDYLKTALQKDNSLREMAREDEDLDSLRNEPGFEFLTE
jgi:tetratricopeptide (TPR) repeat protein